MNSGTALDYSRDFFHELAMESKCSYLNNDHQAHFQCVKNNNNSSLVFPIILIGEKLESNLANDIFPSATGLYYYFHPDAMFNNSTVGYVSIMPKRKLVITSFHGTDGVQTAIADLQAQWVKSKEIKFPSHYGFTEIATRSNKQIYQILDQKKPEIPDLDTFEFVFTGHSLGGAVAALSASMFSADIISGNSISAFTPDRKPSIYQIKAVTFASPMVFRESNIPPDQTQNTISLIPENYVRFEHPEDVVPQVPGPILGYQHLGIASPTFPLAADHQAKDDAIEAAKELLFDQLNNNSTLNHNLESKDHWLLQLMIKDNLIKLLDHHNLDNYIKNLDATRLFYGKWDSKPNPSREFDCELKDIVKAINLKTKDHGESQVSCEKVGNEFVCSNGDVWVIGCSLNNVTDDMDYKQNVCWQPMFSHLQSKGSCILTYKKWTTSNKINSNASTSFTTPSYFMILLVMLFVMFLRR